MLIETENNRINKFIIKRVGKKSVLFLSVRQINLENKPKLMNNITVNYTTLKRSRQEFSPKLSINFTTHSTATEKNFH